MGLYELYKNMANFKPWADPETVQEETDKANTNYWYNRQKAEKEKEEWSKNGGSVGELWDKWLKDTPFGKHMSMFWDYLKTIPHSAMESAKAGGSAGNEYMQRRFATHYNAIQNQNNSIVNNITLTTTGVEDAKLQGSAFGERLGTELANQIHNVGFKIPNNN